MFDRSHLGLAVSLFCLVPASAFAQQPADRTGTDGGPQSTITAPNTNSLGVTKPPGSELGPETSAERGEQSAIRRRNDAVDDSICSGCGVK